MRGGPKAPAWTGEEIALLKLMWNAGATLKDIDSHIRRGVDAVKQRAYQLGLGSSQARRAATGRPIASHRDWADDEMSTAEFVTAWRSSESLTSIALRFGRSKDAVKAHAVTLKLGPRRDTVDDVHSLGQHTPAPRRLRFCLCCETRRPVHEFDHPNDKICHECNFPSERNLFPVPAPRDCWDEDRAIGGAR